MCVQYIQCTCEISKNFKYFSFFRPFVLLFEIESEFEFAGSVDEESTTIPFFISTVIPSECVLQDNKHQSETSSGYLLTQKLIKSTAMSS